MLPDKHLSAQIDMRRVTLRYAITMGATVLLAFCVVLGVPFWYDYCNVREYSAAIKEGNLLVREYSTLFLEAEFSSGDFVGKTIDQQNELLQNKKLISLDYVHQMKNAANTQLTQFALFAFVVCIVLAIVTYELLYKVHKYSWRTPLLVLTFIISLLAIQFFGLPHTNKKFHIIVGLVYAVLIGLSDLLHTLDPGADLETQTGEFTGILSCLQYKHRFYTVVFNLSVAACVTLAATVSFKLLDLFLVVFGENFVTKPLIGLLLTLGLGGLGALMGIFRPIRRHLSALECAMSRLSSNSNAHMGILHATPAASNVPTCPEEEAV